MTNEETGNTDEPPRPVPRSRSLARLSLWLLLILALGGWGLHLWHYSQPAPALARSGGQVAGIADARSLRLAGFNIHRAKGEDGVRDLDRIVAELAGADVAVLNEVGYLRNQHETLAERLEMNLLPAPTETRWGRDAFGNAVLSRLAVEQWAVFPLERTVSRGWRNVTVARIELQGTTLTVLGTHIDRVADRQHQLEVMLTLFESLTPPVVLVGDLNTTGDDPRLARTLARPDVDNPLGRLGGVDPATHIDWILLRGGESVEAVGARLVPTIASDHPVIWVDLAVTPGMIR